MDLTESEVAARKAAAAELRIEMMVIAAQRPCRVYAGEVDCYDYCPCRACWRLGIDGGAEQEPVSYAEWRAVRA